MKIMLATDSFLGTHMKPKAHIYVYKYAYLAINMFFAFKIRFCLNILSDFLIFSQLFPDVLSRSM